MNKKNNIRILSRKSDLAVIQARIVGKVIKKKYPSIKIKYLTKSTKGDIDKKTPLSIMNSEGVFTEDIRRELIANKCDLAVHSWKDLPLDIGKETKIAGTLKRGDIRDILFIKKSNLNKLSKKRSITVLTSSPRRCYNLKPFLENYLPFKKNIKFKNIRGNIPTRFKKYFNNEGDVLIVAKAAVDRLLLNSKKKYEKNYLLLKNIIQKSNWMIVPISQNPAAPGQGALAIEVSTNNKLISKIINSINDKSTYKCVVNERKKLNKYGGGCHQKIGASYFSTSFGNIISEKGELDNGKKFWNWSLIKTVKVNKIKKINKRIFPKNLNEYKWFDRVVLDKSIRLINKLKNSCIFISRISALPEGSNLNSSNIIWTSGMKTWKHLAKKKIWVNGTADGLGEDLDPNISSLVKYPWIKLTHNKGLKSKRIKRIIPTYKLIKRKNLKNLENKTDFYWMSSSAFKLAVANSPKILKARHASGPGNTYKEIKKMIKNHKNISIYLSYKDWKKEISQ